MRTNLPVTQNEVVIKPDVLIVSKTDLKGRITYVNRDFIEVSGFSEPELIGQPHNILRHPDMPVEAFADLWNTLKAGRPWTGYVKNRCKNGDYYWVLANVTPIWEGGNITGYLSVRRTATREAIAAHDDVYRQFREGRQGRTIVRHGVATKSGLGTWFANFGMGWKLLGVMGVGTLLLSLALFLALATNFRIEDQFKGFVDHDLNEAQAYQQMYAQGLQTGQALRNYYLDPSNGKSLDNLKKARGDFDAALNQAKKLGEEPPVKEALAKISDLRDKQKAKADQALELIGAGKLDEARTLINEQETPAWRNLKQALQDELAKQQSSADTVRSSMESSAAAQRLTTLIIAGVAVIGSGILTLLLLRSAQRRLKIINDTLSDVSQGNYSNSIDVTRDDEMGFVLQRLQAMQTRLGFEMAETKRMADENQRVRIALDNVSTGVMIADAQRNIIYTNRSVERILKGAEEGIRKVLPNFDASRLIGVNIDAFHKRPSHQAQMLATLTATHAAKLQLGSRHMTVTANPVINDKGERLGSVAEWLDRTNEVLVEQEVQNIIEGAARGEFNNRLATQGKEGFFHSLTLGINQLMETTSSGLHDVADVLQSLSEGDLTRSIDADYQGLFGQLKDATNTTIGRLQEVMTRIKHASDAIHTAAQEIAAGNTDLSRRTEEQASSLEETASSMEELNATVRQNADNSRQANDLARSSNDVANRGGAMVKQVVTTMDEIQQSSKKISDIIGVIDSIAFQTNILALNAAVEAARAGEQGRGFAVVASEVRNLAQRSATAAKEIKSLIIESVDKVEDGAKLVRTAGSTMEDVVLSFQKVASLVTEISNASREQSSGIEQVTQAVSQMDEVTQQNAALVEQAAAAAESLEDQSNGLVQALSMFKLAEGASHGSSHHGNSPHAHTGSNLPSTRVLRDATPRQLPPASRAASPRPNAGDDEWEEF